MAEKYDILQWYSYFEKNGGKFNKKEDAKKGSSVILNTGCLKGFAPTYSIKQLLAEISFA